MSFYLLVHSSDLEQRPAAPTAGGTELFAGTKSCQTELQGETSVVLTYFEH